MAFLVKHNECEGLVLPEIEEPAQLAHEFLGISYNKILIESG